MNELDTDYLWLRQHQQPQRRLRRFVPLLIICLPLLIGAAWLYSGTSAQPTRVSNGGADITATQSIQLTREPASTQKRHLQTATRPQATPVALDGSAKPQASLTRTTLRFESSMRLAPTDNLTSERATTSKAWIQIDIHKGDTLSTAFARHNLDYSDSLAIAHLPDYGAYFTDGLRAGDSFDVKANARGHVLALKHSLGPARVLRLHATADGFDAKIKTIELNPHITYATGVINNSFYNDALAAGLSPRQVMELTNLFKWEIDFAYGVRPGDRFTVVYSELYKDGRKVAPGHILAVSFRTSNQLFRALRFTGYENETVYYQPDGSSLKRAFIRTPVDYTRISSPFTMSRDHPILDTVRAHEGTDFAAPMGTPVHAAGDGRIEFRGRNGGYGNMIAIDHGNSITTRYGHMSRFASGQSVGTYVEQGETIGYVGSTGLSTGPHLHYEFRVNGTPKNPETVDLPGAPPLPDEYMDEFKTHIKPLIAQLKAVSTTTLARNDITGIAQ